MTSLSTWFQEEDFGISHPSLWLGSYGADHPALSLHCQTTGRTSVAKNVESREQQPANTCTGAEAANTEITTEQNGETIFRDASCSSEVVEEQASDKQACGERDENHTSDTDGKIKEASYAVFSPEMASDLVDKTEKRVQRLLSRSTLIENRQLHEKVPPFTLEEDLCRGDLLGSGGFAMIYHVHVRDPQRLLSQHQTDDNKENEEYVIKHLSPELATSGQERKLHIGTRDFVMEAHLMSSFDHPNILKLVGCSNGGVPKYGETLRTDAFFMVLPKLSCNLTERMSSWQEEVNARKLKPKVLGYPIAKKSRSWGTGAILARQRLLQEAEERQKQIEFFCYRLQVVIDLLKALEYLHSKRVVHRDIKPDNIGFSRDGRLQLFDFGLAKVLPPEAEATNKDSVKNKDNLTFALPGNSGTARYMAPEVILRQPYNCKADVFATSIVCWEVLALKRAYGEGVPAGQFFKDCVAIYNDRPPVPKTWPKNLRRQLKKGWIQDITSRHTSGKMRAALEKVLDETRRSRT